MPHSDMGKTVQNYNRLSLATKLGGYETRLYAGTSEYPAVLVHVTDLH